MMIRAAPVSYNHNNTSSVVTDFNTSSVVADSSVRMMSLRDSSFQKIEGGLGCGDIKNKARNGVLWRRIAVRAAQGTGPDPISLSGAAFQPFIELKSPQFQPSESLSQSLARHRYHAAAEAAVNDQINVEYNVSYVYHGLFAFFDRDNVGLPGFAKFFKETSEEEREDAERLIRYQNVRGGKVVLRSILTPAMLEFDHLEKGEALYAMELSLSLDKLVNEKLLLLHKAAQDNRDPELQHFLETHFLRKQVERIKKVAQYVSQLRRVGKGHGVYHFDLVLLGDAEADVGIEAP